jgi:hypothetical protein
MDEDEQDERVLAVIFLAGDEGLPVAAVAEQIQCSHQRVYESVWRLRDAGRVTRLSSISARWCVI